MESLEQELRGFTGSESLYRYTLTKNAYTDGVKHLAERAEAYWLLDAIFSHRRKEAFQIWELVVKDKKGKLTMREDTNEPILVSQEIEYTDFPMQIVKMYLIDNILLLPSEY